MKRLTQEELNEKIQDHNLWLEGKGGERADFSDCDLSDLDLTLASLKRSIFRGARLHKADLAAAYLREADLEGADLRGADLEGADLRRAKVKDGDLRMSNLRDSNLRETDLQNLDFHGADLTGADLRYAIGYIQKIEGVEDCWDVAVFPYDWISIGCLTHKLDYWIEHYQEIGREQDLDQDSIDQYGKILKSLKDVD